MARAKIFKHGGSQAVRLPKEFRFEVEEVDIRREGSAVILEAPRVRKRTPEELKAFWDEIDAIRSGDELVRPDQPPFPDRKYDW
jgi:antitoxin VapB